MNQLEPGSLSHHESQRGGHVWQPLLEEPLRGRAFEAAHLVARRMLEPDQVGAIATRALQQSKWPGRLDLASKPFGFTEIAFPLVSFGRCFPGHEWNRAAQRSLRLAATATHEEGIASASLFGGTCGLASILFELSKHDGRYTKTLATLNTQICQQVRDTPWQPEQAGGVDASDYDIISGTAGVLAYLVTLEFPTDEVLGAIRVLVQYLIWLADADQQETRERWYIPPELLEPDFERPQYPNGNLNCGLAHGIPGPLVALAIAWNSGYRFPGLREAIVSLSHWVLCHQISDEWGINWPYAVPFSGPEATHEPEWLPARAAWCYGAPGIARALWLAGVALDDAKLRQTAIEAMEAVLRRPIVARQIDSPNLCHGIAGLLQICLRFAHETGNETIRRHIPLLVTQILDLFDPAFALGFRDLDADGVGIDEVTWLTGAPGTALALLAAATAVPPDWDRVLLIS
jgi:lantibiotic biosynthesis protein